jgi:hypothetical protein
MSEALPSGQFSGREAFAQRVRDALAAAAQEGWREIILSDATFEDWPLHERAVVESLHSWAKAGHHLTLLATTYDEVIRKHARFVAWRKIWGHLLDCRLCSTAAPADFPSAIWSSSWFLQRLDPLHSTGVCGAERERCMQLREQLNERIRNSSPGFPASTLGL